jgi:transcription termination factor Rho
MPKLPLKDPDVLNISEIQRLPVHEIKALIRTLGVKNIHGSKRYPLIKLLVQKSPSDFIIDGTLKIRDKKFGILRSSYCNSNIDVRIDLNTIKRYGLKKGNTVKGTVISNARELELSKVLDINGEPPDNLKKLADFKDLIPIYPLERFFLDGSIEMRMMDLLTPIGKGQRGLIVAPPRTGKTALLQQLANALVRSNPESHLIILLIDERPEEVTDMARNVPAEVVASTFDKPARDHVQLAELVISKAKRMVEYGKDVIILLDSITRLGRAYNTETPHSGKILSGGVDAKALKGPKHFFGSARNIEGGGSLTILATALIDTNSTMDKVIFEEFKGTGNMELYLDRSVADRRIWPAFEIRRSGTRKEELLCDEEEIRRTWELRKILNSMNNLEAVTYLKKQMQQYTTNGEFLMSLNMPRKS